MTLCFDAVLSPTRKLLEQVSELSTCSPFNTPAYAAALAARNAQPCALLLRENQELVSGCLSALAGNRWNRRLEIYSAPELKSPCVFWHGVANFCREQKACELDVQTFASTSANLPAFERRLNNRERSEFIMDLTDEHLFDSFSKNHRRSIRKAHRAELELTESTALGDYQTHVQMMQASMSRRSDRGEAVAIPSAQDFDYALLQQGAGTLFQARSSNQVLASILILRSAAGGYYHSAGTLPEGMQIGASPFLISEVAKSLAARGIKRFNLGGVDPDAAGLRRFKSGFSAREVVLSAATYPMISPVDQALRMVARKLKNMPGALLGKSHR